jgi:hypothetical protein
MATTVYTSELGNNFKVFAVDAANNLYFADAGDFEPVTVLSKRDTSGTITTFNLDVSQEIVGLLLDRNVNNLWVFGYMLDNNVKTLRVTRIPLSTGSVIPEIDITIPSKPTHGSFAASTSAFYFLDNDGNCQQVTKGSYNLAEVFTTIDFQIGSSGIAIDNNNNFYLFSGNNTSIAYYDANKNIQNSGFINLGSANSYLGSFFVNNNDLYVSYGFTSIQVDIYNITTGAKIAENVFSNDPNPITCMGFGTTQIYGLTNMSSGIPNDPNALSKIYTAPTPSPPTPSPTPYRPYPCFKEDSKILTDKGYIMIQDLKKGDLVKTLKDGYKPIVLLGKRDIEHKCIQERIKDQLYKCDQSEYPEIIEPLILTGCHSILVDEFASQEQREHTIKINGDTYVTDNKYRLPAAADERAKVYKVPGTYTIYHVALEHENYYANYGIYANGLLVETCSKRYLTELSNMELL